MENNSTNTGTVGPVIVAALATILACTVGYLFVSPFVDGVLTYLDATVGAAFSAPLGALADAFVNFTTGMANLVGLG